MPVIVGAAYNDVGLTSGATISVGSYNLTVSGSTSVVETLVVNSGDFVVTMPVDSVLVVQSAEKNIMTVTGIGGNDYSQECSSDNNTLTISIKSGSTRTVNVTPSTTICTVSSAQTSGSRSSGGGGTPNVATPPVIPASVSGCPAGVICTLSSNVSVIFTQDLSRGTEGADVETLQKFLARFSEIYPEGIANGFFGPATERAVKRFQAKYGISQVGRVGPATRAKIAEVSAIGSVVPAVVPALSVAPVSGAPSATAIVITVRLSKGSVNENVLNLQKILNKDPETQVTTEGVGSSGNEGTYFGSLTEKAVQKFQVKHGIANPGDEGYGQVGPKTRAKLNELGS